MILSIKTGLKNIVQPSKNTNLLSTNIEAFLRVKKTSVKPNNLYSSYIRL